VAGNTRDEARSSTSTSLLVIFLALQTVAQYTYLPDWPGYANLRTCVQDAAYNIAAPIGCPGSWECVCVNSDLAFPTVSIRASTLCSGREQDIASATSLIMAFCNQYPGIAHGAALTTTQFTAVGPTPGTPPNTITVTATGAIYYTQTVEQTISMTITPTGNSLL